MPMTLTPTLQEAAEAQADLASIIQFVSSES